MDNISYIITDTTNTNHFDIHLYNLEDLDDEDLDGALKYNELYTLYMTYSVKSLIQVMNYYKMNCYNSQKKRLLKEEIILLLLTFELDVANSAVVLHRVRLWENIAELSQDSYFKSFITFTV